MFFLLQSLQVFSQPVYTFRILYFSTPYILTPVVPFAGQGSNIVEIRIAPGLVEDFHPSEFENGPAPARSSRILHAPLKFHGISPIERRC